MALTYTGTASWATTGTSSGTNTEYKDVTVTAATGDLLVAVGLGASHSEATGYNGAVATQSGSTSGWTVSTTPDPVNNVDCAVTSGYATVSTGGSITVRVTVGANNTINMGAAVFVIPDAEWTGTPAVTGTGPDNTTGVQSLTLSPTASTVICVMGDWAALDPTSISLTPSGTAHAKSRAVGDYAWVVGSWTTQAAGTRNYGLASDPGDTDYSGAFIVIEEPYVAPPSTTVTYARHLHIG